ncbi:MAG: 2-C-methyl-D-erythritol 2,4-cyclodiphosphate synthase [Clostridia bacterium]|nr:2-C-methyl-D-erythritol 2,4-cyclodiphosphate synthase [Clostridia bacterium]
MMVGIGYDVHRLTEMRPLILGGVKIPYKLGLWGHSDADVLIHAIMDALLGAANLGDIGKLFPDSDDKYKDANSIHLLKIISEKIKKKNLQIKNIDSTIVAQAPRLMEYIPQMAKNIAQACSISPGQVNVKATTEETLGFTGEMLGVKALAICLLDGVD